MMMRRTGPFKLNNPWVCIGWLSATGLIAVGAILGFGVLGRERQNGPPLGLWAGICRGIGITSDTGPASEPQPPLVTPTRIAWTRATLAQMAGGDVQRGEFVAMNCIACHGEQGVSASGLYPTLAGLKAEVIWKQLDDFRAGKRLWGAMNGIAQALSPEASADVAAYFASRSSGRTLGGHSQAERTTPQHAAAKHLVFAGDPARGIAACSVCHGPGSNKFGAPSLEGQQPAYIELQLTAFAQGIRRNDMNLQMRTVATQLTPDEMRDIADFYGGAVNAQTAAR